VKECTLTKSADNAELGGEEYMSDVCAAIQRDMDRLENWTERSFMKLKIRKCNILPLGRITPCTSTHRG